MRILVTGGAGFIGANLVHYLLGDAERECGLRAECVVTLDRLTYAGNLKNLEDLQAEPRHHFVHGDIGDEVLVARLLREHEIDSVMHLAAESHVDRSIQQAGDFILTNVLGTQRLLEAFRRYLGEKSSMPQDRSVFLHVSTDEVFGSLGAGDPPFSETSPYAPNNPYSASKAGGDHLVRAYHQTYGLPVVTTHCANNYGPYQFPEKLIPLMIRNTLRGELLPVYGDGLQIRDWLHVMDHCRALVLTLTRGEFGQSYVIGGKSEVRNIELVRCIIELVRKLAPERGIRSADDLIHHVKDRPGHDLRYAIDSSRIQNELGWLPREDFESGLERTVQWYLDHEPWLHSTNTPRWF
jgi:dTDP-glucose 4,6-dehydratase